MRCWSIADLDVRADEPQVLFSADDSRAVVLRLDPGERLPDDPVQERAWIMPVSGEIEVASVARSPIRGGPGTVLALNKKERHEILAPEGALLLLLFTPWPGAVRPEPIAQPAPPGPSPRAPRDEDPWSLDPLSPIP